MQLRSHSIGRELVRVSAKVLHAGDTGERCCGVNITLIISISPVKPHNINIMNEEEEYEKIRFTMSIQIESAI